MIRGFGIIAANFSKSSLGSNRIARGADVNGDGTVDAADLQIVQSSIGCTA